MNHTTSSFSKSNLQNIKNIFEEKTGVALSTQTSRPARVFFSKRLAALATAIIICVTLCVPALAANIPGAYEFLYAVSPTAAQLFKPVRLACEDNGIRMEVLSTYIHESTAEIYVSIQDLAGNRIDETTDLFDSYTINTPFSCTSSCSNISYDKENKTATFLIRIEQWGTKQIEGDKITFMIRSFLSNKQKFSGPLPELDLGLVSHNPSTQIPAEIRGGGGEQFLNISENFLALLPDALQYVPVNGVTITGLGFIDGTLHVQVKYSNILETDNHGSIYFEDAAGKRINCIATVSFWDTGRVNSFNEYIFDITPSDLNNLTLYGEFTTCDTLTKGNWEITFPLEQTPIPQS